MFFNVLLSYDHDRKTQISNMWKYASNINLSSNNARLNDSNITWDRSWTKMVMDGTHCKTDRRFRIEENGQIEKSLWQGLDE